MRPDDYPSNWPTIAEFFYKEVDPSIGQFFSHEEILDFYREAMQEISIDRTIDRLKEALNGW